ncbi:uncharacterized protein [Drosophila kikkawai]|uniref:Uncharacterized protein n=1 Tax=Drosophila kikkawai TaxID=30033 RepID=A0A6P4IR32_DROKI|nr:uncharacterized protein LOC108080628 [Drosophila kikkawai]KAH8315721.1 hypothetical protein KR059_012650 [Drosophila kikkawai]KAH8323699.1 hypothetical protein KR059_012287 [Drosophila kikkawai]
MNVLQACFLICLGLVFGSTNAQVPTRQETTRDKACGPRRYYSEARHTCLPY